MSRAGRSSGIAALIRDFCRFAGPRLWLLGALMAGGAVAEGFGLIALVPLAAIAVGADSQIPSSLSVLVEFAPSGDRLVAALALFLGAMLARSLLLYSRDLLRGSLQTGYEVSLRLRAAATLARRGWGFAGQIGQARMQSLLLNDVPRVGHAVASVQDVAVASILLLVQLALTFALSPLLTLFALAVLAPGALFLRRTNRLAAQSGSALVENLGSSTDTGFRLHAGLKAALAQGTVPQFLGEYGMSLDGLRSETVRYFRRTFRMNHLASFGTAIAAAALLLVGTRVLHLDFAVLAACLLLFARMSAPALRLIQSMQEAAVNAPSFESIEECLGSLDVPASGDPAFAEPLDWHRCTVERSRFLYPGGGGIDQASLSIERGQWIGIAGQSAAGKTSLVDLVVGILIPQSGSITIDGAPLEGATLDRWRAGLAYVGQDGAVFADSVRANLIAGSAPVADENLWEALEVAGLAERVRSLSGGLDERIGDRGSTLSGGERQRLLIARALLRRPTLIILDEATAAIDEAGEAALIERLQALDPRPAALIVAHRRSTLAHCDWVTWTQHGKLVSGDEAEPQDEAVLSRRSPLDC